MDTNSNNADDASTSALQAVPTWWKIYEGLDDAEIDQLDEAIRQRADLTRSFVFDLEAKDI